VKSTFLRTLTLFNANDEQIAQYVLSTLDTVSHPVTEKTNPWIKSTLVATKDAISISKTEKQGFKRNNDLKYQDILRKKSCHGSVQNEKLFLDAIKTREGAKIALPTGNGVQWQKYINDATDILYTIEP
jgi:hypothetical protein